MKIRLMIILLFIFTTNIVCGLSRHKIENDHPGGTLGYRVKLDGDILASSKYVTDDTSGGVMIYNRNLGGENNWGEEDYLYSPVAAGTGDYFGYATDLYDDILIVGRPGGSNDEKAFIFQRGGDGTWNLVRTLDPSEAPEMDETTDNNLAFGWSVAINDEWAVVGAPNDNSENGTQPLVGDQAGAIYTWRKVAGVWTFYDKWTAYIDDEAEQNDALGRSVDLWGDNIVVGALYADIKDPDFPHDVKDDAGAAYLLHPANGVWYLTKKLQAPFEEAHDGDHFGWDVAIWGSRIIVGAPKHWGGGTAMMHFGAAFTYFRSFGTNHEHTFYDPDPQQSSLFGASVDVYMNSIIISNQLQRRYYPDATPPGDYSVGVTYHYGLCSDAQFHLLHTLWPENYVTDYDDSYACDVTMDGPYYLCVGSFTDDDLANGAGASYVYWLGDYYGEPGDGAEAEGDDGSGGNNGGATTSGSAFPSPYADCVIINEYEATPTGPIDDTQEWIELLVIAEDGVDMRNWLLTDVNPEDFYLDNTNPGYNDASIKFNDYAEFSSIPCGTTIVIYDGNGPTNDVDSSDGDMFIYTESEYLNRVAFSYSTIQLDETNDNITLWADDDGVWDIDNSLPIDHISWGDPLIEPPDGIEWENYIDDGSENRSLSKAYFSSGDDTINDDAADWVTDGTATLGTLNSGQTYSGSGWQPDPSNHVSDFSAVATGFYSIEATWTENDGTVVPDGYLLKASTGSITAPSDGYSPPDDIDLTDGSGNVLVAHGNSSYTFTNCNALTTYNFKIYPYTNSGSLINFKTDGTVPVTDANTPSDVTVPSAGDLIISEIVGVDGSPLAGCGFIEILNVSGNTLDITNCMLRYYCDGEDVASISSFFWVAELGRNEYYIIANHNDFSSAYGFEPDQVDTALPLDGGTDGIDIIYSAMRSETIDQLNEVGAGVTPWSWNSDDVLERNTTSSGSSQTSWTDPGGTGTPGEDGDTPLPVTLSSFTGSVVNGFPTLNWTTESELENLGWNIYRSEDENGFEDNSLKLNNDLIPGMGTISIPTDYVFVDENLDETGTFYYWIQSVSFSCELELFGPVEIEIQNTIPIAPVNSFLTKNYPNPFNPATTIEFGVKEGEIGKLTIYNILGQKVLSRKYEEGFHTFIWDAATYSSGVYFYRLQTPTFHKTDKMIMLK